MKHTMNRVLAMLIALLLALPTVALSDGVEAAEELSMYIEEAEEAVSAGDAFEEIEELEEAEEDPGEAFPAEPFERTATVDDIAVTILADAGVFPGTASLKVEPVFDEVYEKVFAEALDAEGEYGHLMLRIRVLDENGDIAAADAERGEAFARVAVPELSEGARVLRCDHDEAEDKDLAVELKVEPADEDGAIRFAFEASAVYDIVTAKAEAEEAVEAAAEEEPAGEASVDEDAEGIIDRAVDDDEEPVRVRFTGEPADATVTIDGAEGPEADGAWLLVPGEYDYTVEAEGYIPLEDAITVEAQADGGEMVFEYTLVTPAFEGFESVDDAQITVAAEEGALLPGAEFLLAEEASEEEFDEAKAAVEAVRGADRFAAVTYAFNIAPADALREAVQPADGRTADVTFDLEEEYNENLKPAVYLVTGEAGAMTAEALTIAASEGEDDEMGPFTVRTGGFGLFVVEFTYNKLNYVLEHGSGAEVTETEYYIWDMLYALGLMGDPVNVMACDDTMISVYYDSGDWALKLLETLSEEAWIDVELNDGFTYKIFLTSQVSIGDWKSLQAAIDAAGDGATICLPDDLCAGEDDVPLTIPAGKTLTIDLNGHALDRGLSDPKADGGVLVVDGKLTLLDSAGGGAVTGGCTSGYGGGVRVSGTFVMDGAVIEYCAAEGDENDDFIQCGGGVYVAAGGTFEMNGGAVKGCGAEQGGGVYVALNGTFNLNGGSVAENAAAQNGGGAYNVGKLNLSGGFVKDNSAGQGGGVYNGRPDSSHYGIFTMTGGTVEGNSAEEGGGVYVFSSRFELQNGTITGNDAQHGGGVYAGGGLFLYGGSVEGNGIKDIWLVNRGSAMPSRVTLGGDVRIGDLYVAEISGYDPALPEISSKIHIDSAMRLSSDARIGLSVNDDFFDRYETFYVVLAGDEVEYGDISNFVFGDNKYKFWREEHENGEIFYVISKLIDVRLHMDTEPDETVTTTIGAGESFQLPGVEVFSAPPTGLTLTGWHLGDVRDNDEKTYAVGASVVLTDDTDITALWTITWADMQARIDAAANGSVVVLPCDVVREDDSSEPLMVRQGKNIILDLNGYRLDGGGPKESRYSDAAVLRVEGELTLRDTYGGGSVTGGSWAGVVVSDGGSVRMLSGSISGNTNDGYGGGVLVWNGGTFVMEGGEITGNTAEAGGGGVSMDGVFELVDGRIYGNTVLNGVGGGLEVGGGTFTMSGGSISGNTARDGGGVELSTGAVLNLNGGSISGNTAGSLFAEGYGGGVYASLNCVINIDGGRIENNRATAKGGGIYASTATVSLNAGGIYNNEANAGGGIWMRSSAFSLTGGEIAGNNAVKRGGGIYAESASVDLAGGSIAGNNAEKGGGLYIDGADPFTLADAGIVTGNTAEVGGAGLAFAHMTLDLPFAERLTGNTVNGEEANYWLAPEGRFNVTRQLTSDYIVDIGADLDSNDGCVIVTPLSERVTPDNFRSTVPECGLALDFDFNIVYGKKVPVAFLPGEGAGRMPQDTAILGAEYTAPPVAFAAPGGKDFIGWLVGDDTTDPKPPETDITVEAGMLTDGTLILTAAWGVGLQYVDEFGLDHGCPVYTYLSEVEDKPGVTLTTGWYVARGETFNNRVTIEGDVNLIISGGGDGVTRMNGGIHLTPSNKLTVWGQRGWDLSGAPSLEAIPQGNDGTLDMAGIGGDTRDGGGEFEMHSGVVSATGRSNAAGIGGGLGCPGGNVTIYNGKLTARGGQGGAGIGGGLAASQGKGGVAIYGGTVEAYGGDYAAGIGGGQHYNTELLGDEDEGGNGAQVTIYSATVLAKGGVYAAGIGGGQSGMGGRVTIGDGSNVTAVAGKATGGRVVEAYQPEAIGRGYLKPGFNTESGTIEFAEGCSVEAGASASQAQAYGGDDREAACRELYAQIAGVYVGTSYAIRVAQYNGELGSVKVYLKDDADHNTVTSARDGEEVVVEANAIDEGIFEGLALSYIYHGGKPRTIQPSGYEKTSDGRYLYTFVMPKGVVDVAPNFTARTYMIRSTGSNGSIVASVDGVTVSEAAKNDTVRITAQPNTANYYFLHDIWYTVGEDATRCEMIQGSNENIWIINHMPASPVTVHADFRQGVPYIDAKGVPQVCRYYDTIENGRITSFTGEEYTTDLTKWDGGGAWHGKNYADGWYIIRGNVTINSRVNVSCVANVILADGCTVNCKEGIRVRDTNGELTIYGQSGQSGFLKADAEDKSSCAGIGGNDGEKSGKITINGCTVKCWGGKDSAGIGGGLHGHGGSVVINRGTVYAKGGDDGSGIGGGEDRSISGSVTINGGDVTAEGGDDGAGIGGGEGGSQGGNVIINGGTVTAKGGGDAAGIGGGDRFRGGGDGGYVKVTGGSVYAYGGDMGAGIGGGNDGDGGTLEVTGGYVYAKGDNEGAGVGGSDYGDGGKVTVTGGTLVAWGGTDEAPGIGGGDDGEKNGSLTVSGGRVEVHGGDYAAGVGGGRNEKGGTVKITGGTVEVWSGKDCASAMGGGKGNSNNGSVEVGPVMSVRAGGSSPGSYVAWNLREIACKGSRYVKVEVCRHEHTAFSYTQKDHIYHTATGTCSYCKVGNGTVVKDEKHEYAAGIEPCTKCRYNPWHDFTLILDGEGGWAQYGEEGDVRVSPEAPRSETVRARAGDKVRLYAHPGDRYDLNEVVVTKKDDPASTVDVAGLSVMSMHAEFVMPESDIDCTVRFKEKEYAIKLIYNDAMGAVKATVLGAAVEAAKQDDKVTVEVEPAEGYKVLEIRAVKKGDTVLGLTDGKQFTMPDAPVTVFVYFESLPKVSVYEVFEQPDGGWSEPALLPETAIGAYEVPAGLYAEEGYVAEFISTNAFTDAPSEKINEGETIEFESGTTALYVYYTVKGPRFTNYDLVLSGRIGVRFYLKLPGGVGEYEGGELTFTINGEDTTQAVTDYTDTVDDDVYIYTFHINAIQMADMIDVAFTYGDGQSVETHASVAGYVEYVRANPEQYSKNVRALADALADYGHYAQLYLSVRRGWTLGEGMDHEIMPFAKEIGKDDIDTALEGIREVVDHDVNRDTGDSGIERVTFTLMLDSGTAINLYLYPEAGFSGDITYMMDGDSGSAVKAGKRYKITIPDIAAHALDCWYSVSVETEMGIFDIDVSALSYVKLVLEDATSKDDEKAVATAIYNYYFTANKAAKSVRN